MKEILKMYIFIPASLLLTGLSVYQIWTKSGGQEPIEAKKLDVKSIRANPTSFRAVFLPRILAGGGK